MDLWYTDGCVFNSKIFTDPGYVLDKEKGEIIYKYRTNCKIVHNIRPNK